MTLGIILGSSLLSSKAFDDFHTKVFESDFGDVEYSEGVIHSVSIVIIRRHLFDKSQPYTIPSELNYKAMIMTFKKLGCERIIGLCQTLFCRHFIVIQLDPSKSQFLSVAL